MSIPTHVQFWADRFAAQVHVGASERAVVRRVWKALRPSGRGRAHRADRHALMRATIASWREHRDLVRAWRL